MSHDRSVVIHGHFYQPPREDPWLDAVEAEPSAAPYHDWNQRIERECYRAVVAARVAGEGGRIARIVNTLAAISFDVGPTLLDWLESEAPGTYAAILEADRLSRAAQGGHGNAIAMPYHHVILPLASRRDKATEVKWGIADFRRRFGREPVGMWLPETAVDDETLDVLAEQGIAFTVLAPHQVQEPPALGLPGRYQTGGKRTIALFLYDGPISHDVAFGPLVRDARAWAERLLAGQGQRLVSVATDGETYGHHHRFGEMALAALLRDLPMRPRVRLENFAAFLARHPAAHEVTLVAPSSWSCPHGVERWRADCGCKMAPEKPSQQGWREPLRLALEWLAEQARPAVSRAKQPLKQELERCVLRTFTSCGWFFDDVAGIESLQVLRYAARVIELMGDKGPAVEQGFLERLAPAVSNDPAAGTARDLYATRVKSKLPAPLRVAAGHAMVERAGAGAVSVPGYQVRAEGDHFTVEDSRTGEAWTIAVVVERTGPAELTATVTDARGSAGLGLSEVPEQYRDAVRRTVRRELGLKVLAPEVAIAAVRGGEGYAQLIGDALAKAVVELEHADGSGALERALDLALLHELSALPIPFDVQSAFWKLRDAASPARAAALAPLAARLGFTG